jgi:hypothetical protein
MGSTARIMPIATLASPPEIVLLAGQSRQGARPRGAGKTKVTSTPRGSPKFCAVPASGNIRGLSWAGEGLPEKTREFRLSVQCRPDILAASFSHRDPNRTLTINFAAVHSSVLVRSVGDPRLLAQIIASRPASRRKRRQTLPSHFEFRRRICLPYRRDLFLSLR